MENVVAAVISGLVAVALFYLGQVAQRRSDDARWHRDTEDRKRRDAAPAIQNVRTELRAAAALLSSEAGSKRAAEMPDADARARAGRRWEPPADDEIGKHTDAARESAFEIPDDGVAAFVKFAAYALEQSDTIDGIGGPSPWDLARDVEKEVDGVLRAYRHGHTLPDHPEIRRANEAIIEHWERLDALYEEDRKGRLAARAALREPGAKRADAAVAAGNEADAPTSQT